MRKDFFNMSNFFGFGAIPVIEVAEEDEKLGTLPDVNALNEEAFHEDTAAANGSSIAFLARYEEKKFFSQRDSFPGVVLDSLNKVYENKVPVEVVKLSHHASAHDTFTRNFSPH